MWNSNENDALRHVRFRDCFHGSAIINQKRCGWIYIVGFSQNLTMPAVILQELSYIHAVFVLHMWKYTENCGFSFSCTRITLEFQGPKLKESKNNDIGLPEKKFVTLFLEDYRVQWHQQWVIGPIRAWTPLRVLQNKNTHGTLFKLLRNGHGNGQIRSKYQVLWTLKSFTGVGNAINLPQLTPEVCYPLAVTVQLPIISHCVWRFV